MNVSDFEIRDTAWWATHRTTFTENPNDAWASHA